MTNAVLEVENLSKHFAAGKSFLGLGAGKEFVRAVDGVSFTIGRGETFGLVGESGCGKTTIAKLILRIEQPTSGAIRFDGVDVAKLSGKALLSYRRDVQAVFQDPFSSLSPRMRVRDIIGELFSRGYANGLVEEAEKCGMTILRATVGRRIRRDAEYLVH